MPKTPAYPQTLPRPFAEQGKRRSIPDVKSAPGAASFTQGFPDETQLPPNAGGLAPNRLDFQGLFHAMTSMQFWQQSGGQWAYSPELGYTRPSIVFHAGKLWWCLAENGPESAAGSIAPGSNPTVWSDLFEALAAMNGNGVYELCEFYYFRHPTLRPGFQPAQGGLLANAATLYPKAWAYLQSSEGQKLCKTEAEWQAMTRATWATLADGTQIGWNGIGGAPFYAPNLSTGALRLPDLRGMYAEAAGFDALGVGGVHGDAVRNITGEFEVTLFAVGHTGMSYGVFSAPQRKYPGGAAHSEETSLSPYGFNSARVVPTAAKNQPRAWGAFPCVYLGR